MSAIEILSIIVGVLGFWNIIVTIVLFDVYSEIRGNTARSQQLQRNHAEDYGYFREIGGKLLDHLGLRIVRWSEQVPYDNGFFRSCRIRHRYAIVPVGITPEEIDELKPEGCKED
jgi:hypothetical protein